MSGTQRDRPTRSYEAHRDLITSINSQWSTANRTKYDYTYDERGLRTSSVQSGDAFADYGGSDSGATHHIFTYNGRGEVTADVAYLNATATDQSLPLPGRSISKPPWSAAPLKASVATCSIGC